MNFMNFFAFLLTLAAELVENINKICLINDRLKNDCWKFNVYNRHSLIPECRKSTVYFSIMNDSDGFSMRIVNMFMR